jgi:hypothetical protein
MLVADVTTTRWHQHVFAIEEMNKASIYACAYRCYYVNYCK